MRVDGASQHLTQARLKELLDYDPEIGVFTWKGSTRNGHNGKRAGNIGKFRYPVIWIDTQNYSVSRLAWLFVYGEMPSRQLKYVNNDSADARIANLSLRELGKFKHRVGKPTDDKNLPEYRAPSYGKYSRSGGYRVRYGISIERYAAMLEGQKGVCAICKHPETRFHRGRVTNLAVDHNHETGQVRGLLCFKCNTAIGMLREDLELLDAAAAYLRLYADTKSDNVVPSAAPEEQT